MVEVLTDMPDRQQLVDIAQAPAEGTAAWVEGTAAGVEGTAPGVDRQAGTHRPMVVLEDIDQQDPSSNRIYLAVMLFSPNIHKIN